MPNHQLTTSKDLEREPSNSDETQLNSKQLERLRCQLKNDIKILNKFSVNVPNFLIIGVQKGGTTWLHQNLKHHPQIILPNKKELEFFSYYQKKIDNNGWSEYLNHFNKIGNIITNDRQAIAIGEVTPSYFWSVEPKRKWTNPPNNFNQNIPESVQNVLGSNLKLIVCLRNPVDRAISAYLHHVRYNRISPQKQRILEIGHRYGIIDMGFYYQHFCSWLEKFSLNNFKVLLYEQHIKQNKESTLQELCNFLEVDYNLYPQANDLNEFHNKGLTYFKDKGQFYIDCGDKLEPYLVIDLQDIKQLQEIYQEDILQLQELLQLDLSVWNIN